MEHVNETAQGLPIGRPKGSKNSHPRADKKYASVTERVRAWRKRQKELAAFARQQEYLDDIVVDQDSAAEQQGDTGN